MGLKNRYKPGEDKVLVPGDPEREYETVRMKNGIPLLDLVVEDLKKLGERFSVAL
jgi:LDH2 family malate/lactate/ureidoglycolate dehydrogenase